MSSVSHDNGESLRVKRSDSAIAQSNSASSLTETELTNASAISPMGFAVWMDGPRNARRDAYVGIKESVEHAQESRQACT